MKHRIVVRHSRADHEVWTEALHRFYERRQGSIGVNAELFEGPGRTDDFIVLMEWPSEEELQMFLASEELREARRQAGEAEPEIFEAKFDDDEWRASDDDAR